MIWPSGVSEQTLPGIERHTMFFYEYVANTARKRRQNIGKTSPHHRESLMEFCRRDVRRARSREWTRAERPTKKGRRAPLSRRSRVSASALGELERAAGL